jgi:quercetin dioxygenase-like cupin family protein
MKALLKKAKARLKLAMLSRGEMQHVSMEEIPKVWKNFGSKGDRWINVDFPDTENVTGCVYIGVKDSVFDPHIHDHSTEHLTVINPSGKIEVITDQWIKTVCYPNSVAIPKKMPHALIFHEETKLLVMWHPKFENHWKAKFIKE